MAHVDEVWSTGLYNEFQKLMRQIYPGVKIFIGSVEGYPNLGAVLAEIIQTLILTRIVGKASLPESEDLENLQHTKPP